MSPFGKASIVTAGGVPSLLPAAVGAAGAVIGAANGSHFGAQLTRFSLCTKMTAVGSVIPGAGTLTGAAVGATVGLKVLSWLAG